MPRRLIRLPVTFALGLQLQSVAVRTPSDLDLAFEALASTRPSALITLADGMLLDNRARQRHFATHLHLSMPLSPTAATG